MVETKLCNKCGEVKELTEFHKYKNGNQGVANYCKMCCSAYSKENHYKRLVEQKIYRSLDIVKYRNYIGRMRREYNLTEQEFRDKQDEQMGMCAVCGSSLVNPTFHKSDCAMDHDHDSGEARSLLCGNCNTALGLLEEDIERMEAMIKYTKEWKC